MVLVSMYGTIALYEYVFISIYPLPTYIIIIIVPHFFFKKVIRLGRKVHHQNGLGCDRLQRRQNPPLAAVVVHCRRSNYEQRIVKIHNVCRLRMVPNGVWTGHKNLR